MHAPKTVFLTGATSGVGFALAERLLASSFHVIATGRNQERLQHLEALGATIVQADLTSIADIERVTEKAQHCDIIIYSAGVGTFQFAHELADTDMQQMMKLNVLVPMQLTKRLLPAMLERRAGHFIFVGSQAGKVATPKASVYAASKHAIIGYTNALRMEVASANIQVTTVHPGPIDTPFIDIADATGTYRQSLGRYLLQVDAVVDAICRSIERPVREKNIPAIMGVTSKLYAIAPALVERLGRRFFMKK